MVAPLRITRPTFAALPTAPPIASGTKFAGVGGMRRAEAMDEADCGFGSSEPASTGPPPAARRAASPAAAIPSPMQGYMERLVKLIPCEVVGLYLVGNGMIPAETKIATVIWSIVCLLLVVLVRSQATGDKANNISPQWAAVGISSISFVIWVYNMPGPFQAYNLAIPFVGSLAVLVWTFVVPYFYKGS